MNDLIGKTDKEKVLHFFPDATSKKKIVSEEVKLRHPDRIVTRKKEGYEVKAGPFSWFRPTARESWSLVWYNIREKQKKEKESLHKERLLDEFEYFEKHFSLNSIPSFGLHEAQISNIKLVVWNEIKARVNSKKENNNE